MIISLHSRNHIIFLTNILHIPTVTSSKNTAGSWFVLYIVPFVKKKLKKRDFWALYSSWMSHNTHWNLVTDVLGQPIGPAFKVQAVLGLQSMICLTLTTLTTNQCYLISQKGDDLIYTMAEDSSHWLLGIYHVPSTSTPIYWKSFPFYHQLLEPNTIIKFTLSSFDIIKLGIYIYMYVFQHPVLKFTIFSIISLITPTETELLKLFHHLMFHL